MDNPICIQPVATTTPFEPCNAPRSPHCQRILKPLPHLSTQLYGAKSGSDYVDNHKRFALFCKAAVEAVRVLPFGPGEECVFVANDWHSALVPVLIKVSTHCHHPSKAYVAASKAYVAASKAYVADASACMAACMS